MKYETAAEMAQRLNVNIRTVQLWAKNGKLPGAKKVGRDWFIPVEEAAGESQPSEPAAETLQSSHPAAASPQTARPRPSDSTEQTVLMPLLNASFEPGHCKEYIEGIKDKELRDIAWAEYYYFSAQAEKAAEAAEAYLDCDRPELRLSARIIYGFANLSIGRIGLAQEIVRSTYGKIESFLKMKEQGFTDFSNGEFLKNKELCNRNPQMAEAIFALLMNMAPTILHLPQSSAKAAQFPLTKHLTKLPEGLKLFACYIMAHQAYTAGEHGRSLGIIETALALQDKTYPIAEIYAHLAAVMDLMCMEDREHAREHFLQAWELARPDDLIEGIGEHHGLTYGMIENCLKKDFPEDYLRIIDVTYRFSEGWRRVHNPQSNANVADNLTTTEFSIAMLAKRGWNNQEIAEHMDMSVHTVKQYMSVVFQKLGITSRKQLAHYMLR